MGGSASFFKEPWENPDRAALALASAGASETTRQRQSELETDEPDVAPPAPDYVVPERGPGQEGGGAEFSEEEADARRKAVRRKRLGTKALQIPLEKSTAGLAAPTSTGLKV